MLLAKFFFHIQSCSVFTTKLARICQDKSQAKDVARIKMPPRYWCCQPSFVCIQIVQLLYNQTGQDKDVAEISMLPGECHLCLRLLNSYIYNALGSQTGQEKDVAGILMLTSVQCCWPSFGCIQSCSVCAMHQAAKPARIRMIPGYQCCWASFFCVQAAGS